MINNPKQYAQALRAPAAIPHNFGVPAGGSPIAMPSGGVSMPTTGIQMPDTIPRAYPMGGGVRMPAPPRTPETYRPPAQIGAQPAQGRMPIPRTVPHNFGAPATMPSGVRMPAGAVPPRAY